MDNVSIPWWIEALLAETAQHQGSPGPEAFENAVSRRADHLVALGWPWQRKVGKVSAD
jgi:hypothetical protein